ncbi:MAG: Integrase catalytic region, partial [Acidobacteria bacterium]|nr:Integrase catalytic region [Acidobacteriota bacterium]
NEDRPHQALAMKVPADVYTRSPRVYRGLEDLTYPFHDHTLTVTHCGRICFKSQKVNLSQVFAGQNVGVTQVGERIWLVTFMHYDLGYFDDETCPARTDRESLRSESVTYVVGMNCHPCDRNRPKSIGVPSGIRTRVLALKGPRPRPLDDGDTQRQS